MAATCSVCKKSRYPVNELGHCGLCEELIKIARTNMEAAKYCTAPPPKRQPKCPTCKQRMFPIKFRPGKWTSYCALGCYYCLDCEKKFRYDKTCPHDPRKAKPAKSEQLPEEKKRQFLH